MKKVPVNPRNLCSNNYILSYARGIHGSVKK